MSTLPQVGEIATIPSVLASPFLDDSRHFAQGWPEIQRRVYRVCMRFMRDHDMAEDMTSEVFFRAWRSRESFRGTCQPSTWIHRIAVNVCLEYIRLQKSKPSVMSLDEMQAQYAQGGIAGYMEAISTRDGELLGYADRKAVQSAVAELPDLLRVPIELSEFDGYTDGEIAGMLGVGTNTIKSRIYRGRIELRDMLKRRR